LGGAARSASIRVPAQRERDGVRQHSPSYSTVDAALRRAGSDLSPAEGHGLLCAMLCVDPGVSDARWLDEIVPPGEPGDALAVGTRDLLMRLRETTSAELAGAESDLRLLLPEDDATLALRTAALVHWCEAFLYGLGLAGAAGDRSLSAEAREVLSDLSEVSRLDPEASGEEDERAFTEVSEFVRVAVMLIYEELRGRELDIGSRTVH